jgi:hypothetical protein
MLTADVWRDSFTAAASLDGFERFIPGRKCSASPAR